MGSALARLHRRKDKEISHGDEEISFDSWHSGGKGDGIVPQLNGVRYFSFEDLQKYTDNFSQSNLIGQGGFGKVYEGYLPNGSFIAVKRAQGEYCQCVKQFKNEIELLSRIHHKNIVSLLGFCFQHRELLLVYEYISRGSLNDHLRGRHNSYLDWKQRLQVALDIARALAYLHELANPQIIHGDVKPANILLDENLNAKIACFGMSRLNRDKKELSVDIVAGTPGYLDPAYCGTYKFSEKCDVYSFGVVMLRLITAKDAITCVEEGDLPLLKDKVLTAINQYDQEHFGLRDMIDPAILSQARNISLRKFVQLALGCVKESPSDRPFMSEVMKEIDDILQNYGNERTASARYYKDVGNAFNLPKLQRCLTI